MLSELAPEQLMTRLQQLEVENKNLRAKLERKRGEELIENSNIINCNQFLSVFNGIEEAISIVDVYLNLLAANNCRFEGISTSREEAIGKKCFQVFHSRKEPCNDCKVKDVFTYGKPQKFIKKLGAGKEIVYSEMVANPVFNEEGDVGMVVVENRDVTSYQTLLNTKEEKEKLYRQVFESAGDAFIIHDCNGRIIEFSSKLSALLGYSNEELEKLSIKDIDDSNYSKPFHERFEELKLDGTAVFETPLITKHGSRIPVEVSASLMDYKAGKACFAAIRDIGLRKKAERRLRESEGRFRSLVENSPDLIMQFDREFRHLFVNSTSKRLLGIAPEDFIGLTHDEMGFPEENSKQWEEWMQQVFDERKSKTVEFTLQMNGEKLYFEWRLIPEFTTEGKVETLLAVARDITQRRLAQRDLEESETRLKLAMDGASESLWDWYILEQRIDCNDQWFTMLGYRREDILNLGSFTRDIIHPDDQERVKKAYQDHFKGKSEIFEVEHRLRAADGTYLWVLERGKVVERNEQGRAVRALGTCVNITDLKSIQSKLHEAVITKDKFFSIIAHDLKNPFNALLGFSALLKDNGESMAPDQFQECIDLIHSSAHQGYNLLENLLEWSRSQMGKIQRNPEQINLENLLKTNMALHEAKAIEKKIEIKLHSKVRNYAYADEYMVDTVVRNLLSNALKFTYPEGNVDIYMDEVGEQIKVEVRDTGMGISEENMEKLFRLDAAYTRMGTNEEMGTGLGLILCKEFISRNKGDIVVESEVGKGSSFIFTLPVAR
ncbi:MAG: PAS domain S-box protein [Marinifilaceae bacterium]